MVIGSYGLRVTGCGLIFNKLITHNSELLTFSIYGVNTKVAITAQWSLVYSLQ